MRRHVLALIGAIALAAPMIATGTAQAADPPGQPGIPTAIPGFQRGEVLLNWAPPSPSTGILGYEVKYSSDNGGSWSDPINTASAQYSFTVTGLDVRQYYIFQVAAFTGRTATDPAPELVGPWSFSSAPTQPAQSVGPPSYINTQSGNASATLDWEEPTPGALKYQVRYGTSRTGPWQGPQTTSLDHIEIGALTPGTTYYFQVRSFNSDTDKSDWVDAPNPATPTGGPGVPTNVRALAGNASASVSWTAPSTSATSYEVQYRAGTGAWSPTISTTSTSATVGSLTNGVSYIFQVRAIVGGVASAWAASNAVVPVAPQVVPAAPTSVSAHGTDGGAVISWSVLANQPVTTYLIQYSLNSAQWFPTTPVSTGRVDQTYLLGGLTNGQPYYIRVAAANGALASAWTQMAGTVTPAAVPGPPQYVAGVAGNGQVTLTWQPPINFGATSPITGYRIQFSTNGGATWSSAPDVTSPVTTSTVLGLANGTGYIFRVRATSYAGDGAWSANTGIITPPGGPGVPTNVVAVAGNAQATVSWSAASTSGSPIIGYRVTASPGGQTCTTSAVPPANPATNCSVTGLTNGQAYTFTVVAVNGSGTSASSAPSAPVTPKASTTIRITNSTRDGRQVSVNGVTTGITSGTTLNALIRTKAGAAFRPAGQVTVNDDGTFSWSTNTGKKIWIRFTGGGATSNTVIVPAR